jgi:hypothetical protein
VSDQLDLFHQPADAPATDDCPEAAYEISGEPPKLQRTQLTELPGTTWEDMFAGPPSRTRSAA